MDKFKAHRIERLPKTGAKGSNLRHQFILTGYEDYVFIKERRDPHPQRGDPAFGYANSTRVSARHALPEPDARTGIQVTGHPPTT